jgi:hypothetical protein
VASLTTVLHSCGHETLERPQLYQQDPGFATTYQLLGTGATITDFYIQDRLLCHLGHLCVPTSKCVNLIWESYYIQVAGHFGIEKLWSSFKNIFSGPNFDWTSTSISYLTLPMPFPSRPSRIKAYTFLGSYGSPYPWITCLVF